MLKLNLEAYFWSFVLSLAKNLCPDLALALVPFLLLTLL